MVRYKTNYVVK